MLRNHLCIPGFLALSCLAGLSGCGEMAGIVAGLPNDVPEGLLAVYADPGQYGQDVAASDVPAPGTVRDDLRDLSGCWGAYVADAAGGNGLLNIGLYEYWDFDDATAEFTWWTLQDMGGLLSVATIQTGHFSVVGTDRLQLSIASTRIYDPLQQAYVAIDDAHDTVEFLATLDGARLILLMLDNPGDTAPTGSDSAYFTIYTRMDCR